MKLLLNNRPYYKADRIKCNFNIEEYNRTSVKVTFWISIRGEIYDTKGYEVTFTEIASKTEITFTEIQLYLVQESGPQHFRDR